MAASVGWSLVLFDVSVAWTAAVAGSRPRRTALLRTLGSVLAFGAALGLWIRLTWIT